MSDLLWFEIMELLEEHCIKKTYHYVSLGDGQAFQDMPQEGTALQSVP
jgi:hypothetical protein